MMGNDVLVLERMIKYCSDIETLMNQFDRDFERYQRDISFQYSCNMCIIQIGELVSRLSDGFISEYKEIPWYAIKSMRNLHAHDYENVDLEIVWNTLIDEVPFLKKQLENLISK